MHSFTSNSNDRIRVTHWGRTWIATVLIVLVAIALWNMFWISHRVYPLPKDNPDLWVYHRQRAVNADENVIVFIGASRTQIAIDQQTVRDVTGKESVQLAIAGESPIPTLRNLAEDDSFRGIVISDLPEVAVYGKDTFEYELDIKNSVIPLYNANEWIKSYKKRNLADKLEFRLKGFASSIICFPSLGKNAPDALYNISTGKVLDMNKFGLGLIGQQGINTYFDRTLPFGGDTLTEEELKMVHEIQIKMFGNQYEMDRPTVERYSVLIKKIEPLVQRIQARGGKVIFVSYPISGDIWELNEKAFPRKQFWNLFASKTSARTIHFKDYPQLQFECPDGSHLDSKDAPAFTKALMEIIFGNK